MASLRRRYCQWRGRFRAFWRLGKRTKGCVSVRRSRRRGRRPRPLPGTTTRGGRRTPGCGSLGHERGRRYPVDWNQRRASGGAPGKGEKIEAGEGMRGSLVSPDFGVLARSNGKLRREILPAWRLLWLGERRRIGEEAEGNL
jgi:hypothetical protein